MSYKRNKIPATVRNSVWNKYIGKDSKKGLCLCCNSEDISFANFDCGHIISKSKGGQDTIGNLRPICSQCNGSMGAGNMEEFMNKHGFKKCKNWNGVLTAENDDTVDGNDTNELVSENNNTLEIVKTAYRINKWAVYEKIIDHLFEQSKNIFKCVSIPGNKWYEFNGNRWIITSFPDKKFIEILEQIYQNNSSSITDKRNMYEMLDKMSMSNHKKKIY
jgi:hypothetical protein